LDLEGIQELHWDPALKLPSLAGLAGSEEDALAAGPLPADDADAVKQVIGMQMHRP
jgi:hypothetical protein